MERVIYSNYRLYDQYDDAKAFLMEEYPELCNVEVEDAKTHEIHMEPSDNQIWEEIYSEDEFYWNEVWRDVKNFFAGKQVIMFGTKGRWDGTYAGGGIGTFEELFYELATDCDYIEFIDDNGHFYIRCSHHDGSNFMEVKILSQKGYDFADNWAYGWDDKYNFSEQELHKKIATNNFLSCLPHYCHTVWGSKGC